MQRKVYLKKKSNHNINSSSLHCIRLQNMQSKNHFYVENLPVILTGFVSDQLKYQGAQIFFHFSYCNEQWTILRGEQLRLEQVLFQANKKNNRVHRQKPWLVSMELQCKGGIFRENGRKFSAKKCSYSKSTICIHSSINHILRLHSSSLIFFISNLFSSNIWSIPFGACFYLLADIHQIDCCVCDTLLYNMRAQLPFRLTVISTRIVTMHKQKPPSEP